MKNGLLGLLLFVSGSAFTQETVTEKFQKIATVQQAEDFIKGNPELKPAILKLSAGKDSSLIEKRLLRQKKGDIFSVGYVTYKVIEARDTVSYRANYIFLDGSSLTTPEIDSLKKLIVAKASQGTPLLQHSQISTPWMENTTRGDTGWFFGEYQMPKDFEDAVANHKKGDIFFVEVAEKQWHYIVKKTYDDQVEKDIVVLRANGR